MRRIKSFAVVASVGVLLGCKPAAIPEIRDEIIIIDANSHIFLDCKSVSRHELRAQLKADFSANTTIAADRNANINTFTRVLDIVREHRDRTKISLANFPNEKVNEQLCSGARIQSSSKRKTDLEYEKSLIGIWSASYLEGDSILYGETKYNSDGTAVGKGEFCVAEACENIEFTSTWNIQDGILTSVRVTSNDGTPVGTRFIDRIGSINETTLILYDVESERKQVRNKVTFPKMLIQ